MNHRGEAGTDWIDPTTVPAPPAAADLPTGYAHVDWNSWTPFTADSQTTTTTYASNIPEPVKLAPATPPVPPAPPIPAMSLPLWLPIALSVTLLVVQQIAVALRTLPESAPVTIVLLAVTTITAIIPAILTLLAQQHAQAVHLVTVKSVLGVR